MKKEYQQIDSERKIRAGEKVNWTVPSVKIGIWLFVLIAVGRTIVDYYDLIKTFLEGLI